MANEAPVALETFLNEAHHPAIFIFMSGARHTGNTFGLGQAGILKKKMQGSESNEAFENITDEGRSNHCLQVEFVSEWVKQDGYDTQLGAFSTWGIRGERTQPDQGHFQWQRRSWLPHLMFYQRKVSSPAGANGCHLSAANAICARIIKGISVVTSFVGVK